MRATMRPATRLAPFLASALLLAGLAAAADYPWWWIERGVIDSSSAETNDFAVAVQGQLKWFATNACNELEAYLPGGAGTGVAAVVASFSPTNNYAPVTLGQLKAVAAPFYDRLIEEGFTNGRPWTAATEDDADYALANLGQLKNVFSFEVRDGAADTDSDGMPDWWERMHGLDPYIDDAEEDPDEDGLTNLMEYLHGTDPHLADTDGDGLSDGDEVLVHGINPLEADSDSDGLSDGDEVLTHGTDPLLADTDGDGLSDGWEVEHGWNPTLPTLADTTGALNLRVFTPMEKTP